MLNTQSSVQCNLCKNELPKTIFIKKEFNVVKCPSCGLVYIGNPPTKLELKKLYSFDSGYHSRFQVNNHKAEYEKLKMAMKYHKFIKKYKKKGRILDIGCSVGFFLKVARDNGWETYGIEISDDTAKIARERYGLNVFTETIEETNFSPDYFDVITLWDSIEHVENPMETLLAVRKILKHDGIVFLSTPNIDGLFPKLSYIVSKVINYWQHPEPPWHLYQFSKNTINKLLKLTGYIQLGIADRRISIPYVFGGLRSLIKSPRRLLYSIVFMPVLLFGPMVGAGDAMLVAAKKDEIKVKDKK